MDHDHHTQEGRNSNSTVNWVLIGFILVAGYFLVMEHRAHLAGVLNYLPFLLLLACLLMHLFMHRGHGHHHEEPSHKDSREEQK